MMNTTLLFFIFLTLILVVQSVTILYACLIWPSTSKVKNESVFYIGVVIFVTCSTLPFALITGYLVRKSPCQATLYVIGLCHSSIHFGTFHQSSNVLSV